MSHLLVPSNAKAPLSRTGPAVPQLSALVGVVSDTKAGLEASMIFLIECIQLRTVITQYLKVFF